MMVWPPGGAVRELRNTLSEKRFEHSVRVTETAFHIRGAWGDRVRVSAEDLAWAALFHDCAKEFGPELRAQWLERDGCPFGTELLDTPSLVHAALGARVLRNQYGIENGDILRAVAYHPTGHRDLKPVGWLVYMADYLEPGRDFVKDRELVLERACEDPLTGLRLVAELRHGLTGEKGKKIHPVSLEFRDYLLSAATLALD